jgi:zinc protease
MAIGPQRVARFCVALAFLAVFSARAYGDESAGVERFKLKNGLSVILRPIAGARTVAVLVLYNVGGDHDPKGRSGLGHLVEHVYVTAAAGDEPMHDVAEYVKKHPLGWNAQTGDRYTVLASVVGKKDFVKELQDAAARMSDLRVTQADLEREKPRIVEEVDNMFGGIPTLGAMNQARELLRPTPHGGRHGGLPEEVNAITLKEVQERWRRYYKPRNALLVIAGGLDGAEMRKAVETGFSEMAGGEETPAAAEPGAAKAAAMKEMTVASVVGGDEAKVCLAYTPPKPGDDLYAAYLVLVNRFFAASAGRPDKPQVTASLLDDPSVIYISAEADADESAESAAARLEKFVARIVEKKLEDGEAAKTRETLGFYLGCAPLKDADLAMNPYAVAFSLGRLEQLGVDSAKLGKALSAVSENDIRRAATEIFGRKRHTTAFLVAKKRGSPE